MAEYALIINGKFKEIRDFLKKPDDIPHKNVVWLPVSYEDADYDPNNQQLGEYKTRIDENSYVKYREAENIPKEIISRENMILKIIDERYRRLSSGFSYDFKDDRGVHQIGTTAQDLFGWDEVTKAANALVAIGSGTETISIVTDTGPVEVTAIEWLQIILVATSIRQPIWAASFALQEMDEIPTDFTDDKWWP